MPYEILNVLAKHDTIDDTRANRTEEEAFPAEEIAILCACPFICGLSALGIYVHVGHLTLLSTHRTLCCDIPSVVDSGRH